MRAENPLRKSRTGLGIHVGCVSAATRTLMTLRSPLAAQPSAPVHQ